MKIAFITSCLAPGKDGVGDYTRCLAEECERQGHQCALLALNDRFVDSENVGRVSPNHDVECGDSSPLSAESRPTTRDSSGVGHGDGDKSPLESSDKSPHSKSSGARPAWPLSGETDPKSFNPVLRLSSALPWSNRLTQAREFLKAFSPDHLSVQFVSYGFHPKGIELRLPGWFRTLTQGTPVQIMFHELWIGAEVNAPFKARMVGAVQRWTVARLLKQLKPRSVCTTNPAYQGLLQQQGVMANCLPLFGSIPVDGAGESDWVFNQLRRADIPITPSNRDEYWLFGFFGTLHPVWPPEPLFGCVKKASREFKKRVVLCAIGRTGSGQPLWKCLSQTYATDFDFCHFGEESPERISAFLQTMNFGIATTPRAIIGKSATVAAMLDHGLPVIVNRNDVQFRGGSESTNGESAFNVHRSQDLTKLFDSVRRQPPRSRLTEIAQQFLHELDAIDN